MVKEVVYYNTGLLQEYEWMRMADNSLLINCLYYEHIRKA